ncbi:hypothetical protein DFH29DRAFT_908248 [Suillus ampliporus]|nr:hypothetical protein DFH29DRAFT_908248 [Suillus ampliporus]
MCRFLSFSLSWKMLVGCLLWRRRTAKGPLGTAHKGCPRTTSSRKRRPCGETGRWDMCVTCTSHTVDVLASNIIASMPECTSPYFGERRMYGQFSNNIASLRWVQYE